jgi:N utilization substance protein A
MDPKQFLTAIAQIAEEKGISQEQIIETIEMAIAAAYKKDYGQKGQNIKIRFNPETGEFKVFQVFLVVDESMLRPEEPEATEEPEETEEEGEEKKIRFNPLKHMMVEEARKIKKDIKPDEELEIELEAHDDFGRIAAQTAKQVIIQRLREAEREVVYDEYKDREGEIVGGIVQRIEGRNAFVDIGKTVGILFSDEQIPGEFYRIGQRLRVYILKVERGPRGTNIYLSRAYPKVVSKLFAIEVPEIAAGTVVIKSIAREPGSRTKIAVSSLEEGVDPVGSLVGQKGIRVQTVINELNGEKIDIIEWNEDMAKFIANALSPAKILDVELAEKKREAIAVVPEDQLSLAIGQRGQNVRLAAKLTGWKIDVKSEKMVEEMKKEEKKTKKSPKKEKKEKLAKKTRKKTK